MEACNQRTRGKCINEKWKAKVEAGGRRLLKYDKVYESDLISYYNDTNLGVGFCFSIGMHLFLSSTTLDSHMEDASPDAAPSSSSSNQFVAPSNMSNQNVASDQSVCETEAQHSLAKERIEIELAKNELMAEQRLLKEKESFARSRIEEADRRFAEQVKELNARQQEHVQQANAFKEEQERFQYTLQHSTENQTNIAMQLRELDAQKQQNEIEMKRRFELLEEEKSALGQQSEEIRIDKLRVEEEINQVRLSLAAKEAELSKRNQAALAQEEKIRLDQESLNQQFESLADEKRQMNEQNQHQAQMQQQREAEIISRAQELNTKEETIQQSTYKTATGTPLLLKKRKVEMKTEDSAVAPTVAAAPSNSFATPTAPGVASIPTVPTFSDVAPLDSRMSEYGALLSAAKVLSNPTTEKDRAGVYPILGVEDNKSDDGNGEGGKSEEDDDDDDDDDSLM